MTDRELQARRARRDELLRIASSAVAMSLAADGVTRFHLQSLLRDDGQPLFRTDAAMERFIAYLADFGVLAAALDSATRADAGLWESDIAAFFLCPQVTYVLHELAALWRVSNDDVLAIYRDEVEEFHDPALDLPPELVVRVTWHDAERAAILFNLMPSYDVERALGRQFARVRPEEWRTRPVLLRLPEWLIARIERESMIPATASIERRIEAILMLFMEAEAYVGEPRR